jgi:hypothetical protein
MADAFAKPIILGEKDTERHMRQSYTKTSRSAIAWCAFILPLGVQHTAWAVNWEQQAERLLQISATLLDGVPIVEPGIAKFGLGLKLDTSFLPKPNTTIGSKSEKVPSSPVHAVPTVGGYGLFNVTRKIKLGANAYAGYLVPGVEGLVGVKAKLSQLAAGGGVSLQAAINPSISITTDAGVHYTSGTATGAITAPSAEDTFKFSTVLLWIAPGIYVPRFGLWSNMMFGTKATEAELNIPADKTDLKIKDSLKDSDSVQGAPLPVWFQFTIGWRHRPTGISAALAYLVVPARVYMPRLHVGWTYAFSAPGKAMPEKTGSPAQKGSVPKNTKGNKPPNAAKPAGGLKAPAAPKEPAP